ncbi:MAG: hypothetical protein JO322_04555 [Candidatus Eremiobacteraeota bacterium]|nr:hypothetical protein [Candidatus Eremiobacteraeota bacterium]
MKRRLFPLLAAFVAALLSACSGGQNGGGTMPSTQTGSESSAVLKQSASAVKGAGPQKALTVPKYSDYGERKNFLFVANFSEVDVYRLPLNNWSTPVATLTGFTDARDAKVDGNYLSVADKGGNTIYTYQIKHKDTFILVCQAYENSPTAEETFGGQFYFVSNGLSTLQSFTSVTPCTPPSTSTSNGISGPNGLDVDYRAAYVANTPANTVTQYPLSLTNGEAPSATVNAPAATNVDIDKDDLYVTQNHSGSPQIVKFDVPLYNYSTPETWANLPPCAGSVAYGIEAVKDRLYVSDSGCGKIYVFKLPINNYSSPLVTVNRGGAGLDVYKV